MNDEMFASPPALTIEMLRKAKRLLEENDRKHDEFRRSEPNIGPQGADCTSYELMMRGVWFECGGIGDPPPLYVSAWMAKRLKKDGVPEKLLAVVPPLR